MISSNPKTTMMMYPYLHDLHPVKHAEKEIESERYKERDRQTDK